MSYALTATTDLETLLTNVKEELSLTNTTSHDFQLRRLLKEGAKEIFSLDNVEQRPEVLDIIEKKAKLPCDFMMFNKLGGWRFTNNGITDNYWYRPVVVGGAFFRNNNNQYCWETVQRVGGCLYFDNWDDIMPRQIEISALFIKKNENGSVYIPEVQTRPLVAYAAYKFIRSKLGMQGFSYNQVQMNDFKIEWSNGKKYVQAKSKMPDAMTKITAARVWNALLW